MASLWGELRRRNVFKVAVAYAIVAWLLIQVAVVLLPMFKAPDWIAPVFTFFLILGFPLILLFAWAFEITPEGVKRTREVPLERSITHITGRKFDFAIIGLLAIAVLFLLVDNYLLRDEVMPVVSEQTELVIPPVEKSIAVLPFVNMSADPDQEYFSDGLSEEILNLLAKTPELKVIGRTSSFAFKGKNEDLRVIGQALGVKTLLEGSVRKSGERVRISAQLVDVSDGAHIWSETYDRTMTDIFAVQDDVAAAIIDALQIHLSTNPSRGRPTENTEAYALFLKARVSIYDSEAGDPEELLLKAIELDPNFAEAYELLAYSYSSMSGVVVKAAEAQKLMHEFAARALAIDPDLAFARVMYQIGNLESWSFPGEIEALERAAHERAINPAVLEALIFDLLEAGYLREALDFAEQSVDLEPLSPIANQHLFEALYAVGRTSEAIAALELAGQLGNDYADWALGGVNLVDKRDDIAIAHFEAWLQEYVYPDPGWVRDLVNGARDPVSGQAHLDRRIPQIAAFMPEEKAAEWRVYMTMWYLFFGFLDRYFELILATELTDSRWTDADVPVFDGTTFRRLGFTAHPKYLEVAGSIGIIDVWEQRGPPDFCEKMGGEWVCE